MKKKAVIVLLSLVIFVVLGTIGLVKYVEARYTGKIVPLGDVASVYIEDLSIGLMDRNVKASGIVFPDSVNAAVKGRIDGVKIEGIRWLRLLSKTLVADDVRIAEADFEIALNRLTPKDDTDKGTEDEVDQVLKFDLHEIALSLAEDGTPNLKSIDLEGLSYRPGVGNYDVDVRRVFAEEANTLLEIDSVMMKPRFSKYDFGAANGVRTSRVDFTFPKIRLNDFAVDKVISDSLFTMSSVELERGELLVFTDKRLPLDINKYAAMPHELLMTTGYDVVVDSLVAEGIDIRFEAINPNTLKLGYLDFDNSVLKAVNINNTLQGIADNNIMTLDVSSNFTNEGRLKAHFDFHLDRQDFYFHWFGDLGPMHFSKINTFMVPVANMNIVEGTCHWLRFDVHSDVDSSRGTIDFEYEDLKVVALNPEKQKERGFLTGMANLFVVRHHNLADDKKYVEGQIRYAREKHRGFEHMLYSSLERGIMYTILPYSLAKAADRSMSKSPEEKLAKEQQAKAKESKKDARKRARQEKKEHRHKNKNKQ